ncbi:CU044_5270 family protein [Streptacidiphilus sp. N1-12]|uniref:CU044_5270 family protein n=2 Tax=Streptacidiphilus alkalitolerans TaxID=3342712 RepID=A0ABV6V9A0_9ACTN
MNATEPRPERAAREELARLLPVPAERDLPTDRSTLHRENLMRHFTSDAPAAAPVPADPQAGPSADPSAGPSAGPSTDRHVDRYAPRPRPRRPLLLRPALLAPLVAAALVGALAVGAHQHSAADHSSTQAAGAVPDPVIAVLPGSTAGLSSTLGRIADAASVQPVFTVKPDQYVYTKTVSQFAGASQEKTFDSPWVMYPVTHRETWYSQRPGTEDSFYRENGQDVTLHADSSTVGINNPTYAWTAALPTDPAALLAEVYADTRDSGTAESSGPDQAAFAAIGELLGDSVMPPKVEAALYRAVARIPGVVLLPDAVDAAGRHGIGVARVDNHSSERSEWIFDKDSLRYLGERDYLVHDTVNGKAGMLIGVSAVLARGVADTKGGAPVATE